jgi:hypothetical protein
MICKLQMTAYNLGKNFAWMMISAVSSQKVALRLYT